MRTAGRHVIRTVRCFSCCPKTGLLGVAAVTTLAAGLAGPRPLPESRSTLGDRRLRREVYRCKPTDFTFLVAVAIGWMAFGSARCYQPGRRSFSRPRSVSPLLATSFVLAAIAYIPLTTAEFSYGMARDDILAGRWDRATPLLAFAISADPGMALYSRQRGSLAFVRGRSADARVVLRICNFSQSVRRRCVVEGWR